MRYLQKENQPSILNQTITKHRKTNQHGRPSHKDQYDYQDKIAILKQSALQALAEKNEVIEVLVHSLTHQQQLTCSLADEKAEDSVLFELLSTKVKEKNEQVENAWEQVKKKERQMQQLKEEMENVEWQRNQLLGQLERYEVQNQDLRQIITELVAENQKLRELLQHPNQSQSTINYQNSHLTSLAGSAAKDISLPVDYKNDNYLDLHSAQPSQMESEVCQNRSPALNVLLFERTASIAQFNNFYEENEFVDFYEHSIATQEMKESLVKKHCLGLSLKAINLIDTYSLNSTTKKVTDCESQMTARYFQYVHQKDMDRGCQGNSGGDLQMQSYEDIAEQPEQQQAEQQIEQQSAVKEDGESVFSKLRWTALGMLLGSTLALFIRK